VTVLSRCLQFNLKNLMPEKIVEHLKAILDKEVIPHEDAALWLLARAADGSMRDALSLTDQAIAFGGERISEAGVRDMLGTMDRRLIHPILDALIARDANALLAAVAQLAEQNPDYSGALDELLSLLHRIAVVQAVPQVLEQTPDERERLQDLASHMTAEDVQLCYQIGLNSQRDLPFAPDMRSGFEMALLRMLAFQPHSSNGGNEKKKTELKREQAAPAKTLAQPTPAAHQPITAPTTAINPAITAAQTTASTQVSATQTLATQTPIAQTPPSQNASTPQTTNVLQRDNWPAVWQCLPLAGVVRNTASHCSLDAVNGTHFQFTLDSQQAGLFDDSHSKRLADALNQFLGTSCTVNIVVGTTSSVTPAQVQQEKKRQQRQQTEDSFRNDPNVIALVQQFEAEIIADSIEAIQRTLH
jgi:DNA polymerase-3 subunit gamma/tau